MSNETNEYRYDSNCRNDFSISSAVAGAFLALLFGVALGILFFFGVIETIETVLWVIFGIGAFALAAALVFTAFLPLSQNRRCLCRVKNALIVGGLGAIVTSVIALSITLVTFSIGSAILTGIAGFFGFLALTALISFVICAARCC